MDQSPTHDMYISHSPPMIDKCLLLSSRLIKGRKHSNWPPELSITQALKYSLLVNVVYRLVCMWVCGWYLPIIWDSPQIKNTLIFCSNVSGSGGGQGGATAGTTRSMEPGKPFKHFKCSNPGSIHSTHIYIHTIIYISIYTYITTCICI